MKMDETKDENSNDEPMKYMEQFLYKKEANGKWIEYWVVCRGNYLLFYSHHCESSELRDAFRGFIELTVGTRCLIGKRKKYSFPFYLATQKAKYYFKTPTLLLRHQWIHAIDLSLRGRYPESPPTTLPSPNSRRQQDIEIVDEDESSDVNSSVESAPIISSENEDDADVHTSDLPKNIIMVTSIPDGSNEVTNFTGDKVSPNTNNYRVTNFLKARTEGSNSSNGVVNLSYEEDSVSESANKGNSKKTVLFRNVSPQQPVIKPPVISNSSPSSYLRSDKWLNRVTRSADSNRGSTYGLLGSVDQNSSSSFVNVKPTSSSLSVNTSRFSRHLVCSAPDLQSLTIEQL